MYKFLFFTTFLLCSCSDHTVKNESVDIENDSRFVQNDSVHQVVDGENAPIEQNNNAASSESRYSYKVVFKENSGWGYQIFDGAKLLINQEHIPAIQGLQGFSTRNKAEKTAQFVLDQIDKGNFPPTLSKEILDSLQVL